MSFTSAASILNNKRKREEDVQQTTRKYHEQELSKLKALLTEHKQKIFNHFTLMLETTDTRMISWRELYDIMTDEDYDFEVTAYTIVLHIIELWTQEYEANSNGITIRVYTDGDAIDLHFEVEGEQ